MKTTSRTEYCLLESDFVKPLQFPDKTERSREAIALEALGELLDKENEMIPLGLEDESPEDGDEDGDEEVVPVFVELQGCEEGGSGEELAKGVDEFWREAHCDADLW